MVIRAYISFCFKNYLRQHRYLGELIIVALFIIPFEGLLLGSAPQDRDWLLFAALAAIVNLFTAVSFFFFERGNTLHFLLAKPDGRKNLLLAKVMVTILVDLFWVLMFALLYSLRYMSLDVLLWIPVRMVFVAVQLTLSTLMVSLAYTYRPQISWLLFLVLVLGYIVPKEKLAATADVESLFQLLLLLLPPFLEMIGIMITLEVSGYNLLFLCYALVLIAALFYLSYRRMRDRSFT